MQSKIDAAATRLVSILNEKKYTITTAESCTGGLVAASIVGVPGASSVLNEAHITYSNEAKNRLLKVRTDTLDSVGAVSFQTAKEMAKGAAELAGADCSIVTTGIAGPTGGTDEKPVGTVYIGYYINEKLYVEKHLFTGDRNEVRLCTVLTALGNMCGYLLDN